MRVKYPQYRDELVRILDQDQLEVREYSRLYKEEPNSPQLPILRKSLTERNLQRVHRVIEILQEVEPTINNIGEEGIEAVSVIALHSRYSILKKILKLFLEVYERAPSMMKVEYLPAMTDRVLLLEGKKQRFGTQWLMGANNKPYLYPVEDFKKMNVLRSHYGLPRARRPRDLTYGMPKGPLPPFTKESDQRQPTKQEYKEHVKELQD